MLSPRVAKDHFAQHPPWEFLLQGESVEGGGLECGYEDGDQPENQEHRQWVCESRVGTTGGRELGRGEEALVRCHFPMLWSVVPSYWCKRNAGGQAVAAGGSGTSLEQYIPSASTSQVVPEDKEAERSTTRRASHLPRSLEERKRVARAGGVSELRG